MTWGISPELEPMTGVSQAMASGSTRPNCSIQLGRVTEGSTSNVFFVQHGVLVTPPLELGILEGVTRAVIIGIARDEGFLVHEEPHGPEALAAADEVFMTSTLREAMPVTSLVFLESRGDQVRQIAGGKPGPVAKRLRAAFRSYVERTHLRR